MTSTLSSKYQIVIPKELRTMLQWKVGMKLQIFAYEGRVEIVPVENPEKYRGAFPKLKPVIREQDRL